MTAREPDGRIQIEDLQNRRVYKIRSRSTRSSSTPPPIFYDDMDDDARAFWRDVAAADRTSSDSENRSK